MIAKFFVGWVHFIKSYFLFVVWGTAVFIAPMLLSAIAEESQGTSAYVMVLVASAVSFFWIPLMQNLFGTVTRVKLSRSKDRYEAMGEWVGSIKRQDSMANLFKGLAMRSVRIREGWLKFVHSTSNILVWLVVGFWLPIVLLPILQLGTEVSVFDHPVLYWVMVGIWVVWIPIGNYWVGQLVFHGEVVRCGEADEDALKIPQA